MEKLIKLDAYTIELTVTHRGEYNSRIFLGGRVVAAIMDLRDLSMGFCPVPHIRQELSELVAVGLHIEAIRSLK
jgi:hypothetical protein